jgi:hypothetical protein
MIYDSLRAFARRHPTLYFALAGKKPGVRELRAHSDYDLIVEGFPRSANTSSMYALHFNFGDKYRIGHHLHVPAHIRFAVKHSIPCLVIMRDPLDCIASLIIMQGGGSARSHLRDYIEFAETVHKYREHIVIARFDSVVSSGVGPEIERINERFGTAFPLAGGSEEEKAWVEEQIHKSNQTRRGGDLTKLSMPSEAKRAKVPEIKAQIEQEEALLARARKLYRLTVA